MRDPPRSAHLSSGAFTRDGLGRTDREGEGTMGEGGGGLESHTLQARARLPLCDFLRFLQADCQCLQAWRLSRERHGAITQQGESRQAPAPRPRVVNVRVIRRPPARRVLQIACRYGVCPRDTGSVLDREACSWHRQMGAAMLLAPNILNHRVHDQTPPSPATIRTP